jgi:membrane-associated phospholipid phosphatase
MRIIAYALVVIAWCIVGVSSWLLRTHWPTDLLAGFILGGIAVITVVNMLIAAGLSSTNVVNREATSAP